MRLLGIKAQNFLSFESIEYMFLNGRPVLIQGENLFDEGQESNGSGKSGISNIIEYCLLKQTSRKTKDPELIRVGQTEAYVSLEIECPVRAEKYLIERKIHIKNGGSSQLSINGVVKFDFDDRMVSEIDKMILEWLGISKEDILNYFLISKFKYTSFFSASNTALVNLIGRFSNSKIIDGIDKDIEKEAGSYDESIKLYEKKIDQIIGTRDAYTNSLNEELNLSSEDLMNEELNRIDNAIEYKLGSIPELREKASSLQHEIRSYQSDIKELSKDIDLYKSKINEIDLDKFESEIKDLESQKKEINDKKRMKEINQDNLRLSLRETNEILSEIENNLVGVIKCPNCSFEFLAGKEDIDINDERKQKEETEILSESISKSISQMGESIKELEGHIQKINKSKSQVEATISIILSNVNNFKKYLRDSESKLEEKNFKIDSNSRKIKNIDFEIEEIQKAISRLKLEKVSLKVEDFDNTEKIKSIQQLIKNCDSDIEESEKEIKAIKEQISSILGWAYTFKEFKQHLSNKALKVIQGYANSFLKDLGVDMRVSLSGYKMKSDGTLSDKINTLIIRDGEENDFWTFSGGERARVEAAMILSVQKAINSTHPYGGLDFLLIDEVLDSSDGMGLTMLMKSFEPLGKTIMLTTHIPIHTFEFNVLKIVKENKISRIA